MNIHVATCLRSLLLLLLLPAVSYSADWNQWRGAGRDGVDRNAPPLLEKLPTSGLRPLWIADEEIPGAKSGGWSSPVVAGGKVYLFAHRKTKVGEGKLPPAKYPYLPPEKREGMSDAEYEQYEQKRRDEQEQRAKRFRFDEFLYCLDAATGKLLWTNQHDSVYTRFAQSGSPAVVGNRAYVLGAGRVARAIDITTGKDVWSSTLPGEFRDEFLQSSFVVTGNVAAVLCGPLFGLDTETGKVLWKVGEVDGRGLHSSPVVWRTDSHSRVIANLDGQRTICVDAATGRSVWEVRSEGGHATPIIVGNRLLTYGSSRKKGLRCFAMNDDGAELQWTFQGAADSGSTPVVVGDHVYVQGERRLACVSLETGKAAWTSMLDLNRPRYTSLVAVNDRVIYAFDGVLGFAADPAGFRPWMQAKIDNEGLLAEEADFRRQLDLDRLEKTAAGQAEAEKLWRQTFNQGGPLACATPALVEGKLFVRLKSGIACYDLTR